MWADIEGILVLVGPPKAKHAHYKFEACLF